MAKTLGHRGVGGSWATPSVLSPTVAALPGTKHVHLQGTEQLRPQAGQGEVLPATCVQRDREAWNLALLCVLHLGSRALFGVLGCCCLWAGQVAGSHRALICVPSGLVLLVLG